VALGQVLLMLTAPGIPAIYQGDELWSLSLVDPDNRRPVDWRARSEALDRLFNGAPPDRATRKLFVIWKALMLRDRRPEAFAGSYTPLDAGPGVCAFLRGDAVLAIAPVRDWSSATLAGPGGRWRDVLTGVEHHLDGPTPLAPLVAPHGIALLEHAKTGTGT